ncbi:MFS transporter [Rhodococcus sp. 15-725-2-2b]|uniref:MFS transporter n=1 Tax=unclassified Rhodococcus (in: high G+C Gram-positive bacteria) TaxID=192944 RepID=UPI000B9A3814|nr:MULTISPECIES: MFS transporter [unclassified Rhodococcus (in: high G+C Gram-positive bacteria)]OZC61926.1 MFS transporter [Rhodococcus sp. 06-470-2]OZC64577.1 MFS transporter [Rhodococcus sp. 06-469-3-2]OZD51211.1 MFS transporter [Rhodococcus sp. 06-1477-1A]OZE58055.1 MFS transporter [Rhodococcus sp. 05-2221-1B]OZE71650.1 MFS transporter [Rhodococcus sp. 15-725-2-2b]
MTRSTETGLARTSVPFSVRGAAATGTVLQPLNSSMIAVAIVGIAAQFGPSANVSWVISAMYITTAVCAPMAGRLGSMLGARRVFLAGLAFVASGSVCGAFAPNIGTLIASYVVLGVGISAHMPNAMTMVRAYGELHGQQTRTALTTIVMCGQSVAALGPTVGGLLVGTFGWQSILWVNLPVVAISAIAVLSVDVGDEGRSTVSVREALGAMDGIGIAFFVTTVASLMVFLASIAHTARWWILPVSSVAFVLFVVWERRTKQPFFDVRALAHNRALAATLGGALITYTCFYCVFFGIPQWLQASRGMTPIETGLTMLPVAGVTVLSTVLGARVYGRFGARRTLLAGTVMMLVGGTLIATVESSTAPIYVLLLVAAVLGIPNGFHNIGNQSLINATTSVDDVGTAIGMYRTIAFVGANLAVVVLQITAGPVVDDAGLHRTGVFIMVCAAVVLAGLLAYRRAATSRS